MCAHPPGKKEGTHEDAGKGRPPSLSPLCALCLLRAQQPQQQCTWETSLAALSSQHQRVCPADRLEYKLVIFLATKFQFDMFVLRQ